MKNSNISKIYSILDHTAGNLGAPYSREAKFFELIQMACLENSQELEHQIKQHATIETHPIPIIAVCGTLNSGKTSLCASLLSKNGQARTLIGALDTAKATNRFTLWMPESWRNDPLLTETLEDTLELTFGQRPEWLSDDQNKALSQQNASNKSDISQEITVPLLAFDPKLDSLGLSLLDCPDVQRSTDSNSSKFTSGVRMDTLKKAFQICSAFVVVASETQMESEEFGDILKKLDQAAPLLPIGVFLNKIETWTSASHSHEFARNAVTRWFPQNRIGAWFGARYAFPGKNGTPAVVKLINLESGEALNPTDAASWLNGENLVKNMLKSRQEKISNTFETTQHQLVESAENISRRSHELRSSIESFVSRKYQPGNFTALGMPGIEGQIEGAIYARAELIDWPFLIGPVVIQTLCNLLPGADFNAQTLNDHFDDEHELVRELYQKNFLGSNITKEQIRKVARSAKKSVQDANDHNPYRMECRVNYFVGEVWNQLNIFDLIMSIIKSPLTIVGGIHPDLANFIRVVVEVLTRNKATDHYYALCDAAAIPRGNLPDNFIYSDLDYQPAIDPLLGTPWFKIDRGSINRIGKTLKNTY